MSGSSTGSDSSRAWGLDRACPHVKWTVLLALAWLAHGDARGAEPAMAGRALAIAVVGLVLVAVSQRFLRS